MCVCSDSTVCVYEVACHLHVPTGLVYERQVERNLSPEVHLVIFYTLEVRREGVSRDVVCACVGVAGGVLGERCVPPGVAGGDSGPDGSSVEPGVPAPSADRKSGG